jgi:hypothetical protein
MDAYESSLQEGWLDLLNLQGTCPFAARVEFAFRNDKLDVRSSVVAVVLKGCVWTLVVWLRVGVGVGSVVPAAVPSVFTAFGRASFVRTLETPSYFGKSRDTRCGSVRDQAT